MVREIKGVYVLIIGLGEDCVTGVGSLGELFFGEGIYLYVGSGRGPGGLLRRLSRHVSREGKRVFWHVDYLLTGCRSEVVKVVACVGGGVRESDLVNKLISAGVGTPYVRGFGSSDDREAETHLLKSNFNEVGEVVVRVAEALATACRELVVLDSGVLRRG